MAVFAMNDGDKYLGRFFEQAKYWPILWLLVSSAPVRKTFLPAIYESRLLMFNKTSIELEKTPYYKDHTETFGYNQCVSIYTTLEIDINGDVSLCRNYHDYVISNVQKDRVVDM